MAKQKGKDEEYAVSLEIRLSAPSPLEAAKLLDEWMNSKHNNWQFFVQKVGEEKIYSVDLEESDEDAVTEYTDYQPVIKN